MGKGLTNRQITNIFLHVVPDPQVKESELKKTLKDLCPNELLSSETIQASLSCLSCRRSLSLKATILKFLLCTIEIHESYQALEQCYGVLFHFLDYETLRPFLFQLLFRVTKRVNVVPFRCRKLISMYEKIGHDPQLIALMALYKALYPSLMAVKLPPLRKVPFKDVDPTWRAWLVQHIHPTDPSGNDGLEHKEELVAQITSKRLRLSKTKVIPMPETSAPDQKATVADISSMHEFVKKIDSIVLPDQVVSVLNSDFLQHFLALKPDGVSIQRLSWWLVTALNNLTTRSIVRANDLSYLQTIFRSVVTLSRYIRELLPEVENFLVNFFANWNGLDCKQEIFDLLPMFHPNSFENIFGAFFPLQKLFVLSNVRWKAEFVSSLTLLVENWASKDWKAYYNDQSETSPKFELLAPDDGVDHFLSLYKFIKHVDKLCTLGLQLESDHPIMQHATLEFFEMVVQLVTRFGLPFLIIPSPAIVYRCAFSSNAFAVSRICGIISQYKPAVQVLKGTSENGSGHVYFDGLTKSRVKNGLENLDTLNTYICDLKNALWSAKIYRPSEKENTLCFAFPDAVKIQLEKYQDRDYSFSIMFSTPFLGWTKKHLSVPPVSGVTGPKALKKETGFSYSKERAEFLQQLKSIGLTGIYDFLSSFLELLLKAT
eukprot:NODE_110_length_2276_cov_80.258260_g87_i0.p1 GENE.NODE_110_length_2276_cov_80.258260_g87_i0~~NODE_110_length_2276_cov_80.258260_g87_i0.p1  ORF type:complete len:678 (+),score=98.58 NODE_110_length_2276_cov_80.258260_g87_i0:65-2035(+)